MAVTASGGAPYSSLVKAFWNASKIPMERDPSAAGFRMGCAEEKAAAKSAADAAKTNNVLEMVMLLGSGNKRRRNVSGR